MSTEKRDDKMLGSPIIINIQIMSDASLCIANLASCRESF